MFGTQLFWKVLVVFAKLLDVGSVVVGDDDGVVRDPNVPVEAEEEIMCEVPSKNKRHSFTTKNTK